MAQQVSVTDAGRGRAGCASCCDTAATGAPGIRIGVRTAGCSGLTYTIDFAREIERRRAR